MKLINTVLLLAAAVFIVVAGCKPAATCAQAGGGNGGNASIAVSPSHYGAYVDSFTVYVKYGTLDAPANGIYDDSLKCTLIDTIPTATFTHLKAGLYYFFGKGYHTAYASYVKGGVNYTMCSEHAATLLLPTDNYNP